LSADIARALAAGLPAEELSDGHELLELDAITVIAASVRSSRGSSSPNAPFELVLPGSPLTPTARRARG